MNNLDESFVKNMKILLAEDYGLYEAAMHEKPIRGIRCNPLKISKQKFLNIFPHKLEQISYEENGFVLETDEKLGNGLLHMSGCFYLQEPSSMMPVACLNVDSDARVLDLCAAPGGKSSQVAVKIPDGLLVSNEIVTNRAKVLFSNIERMGIRNSVVLNDTPDNIAGKLEGFFDAVIVDAPCGGEGMFRKDPSTIEEWNIDRLESNHQRQIEILKSADKCLKQGGKLVYSTCTFSEIENEDVILEFLENHDYQILEVPDSVKKCTRPGTKIKEARRFYPFSGKGEGQFVCVLQKKSETDEWTRTKKPSVNFLGRKDKEIVNVFLKENFDIPFDYELIVLHESVMLVRSSIIDVCSSGLNIINAGVRVGSIEKGVLRPHHQLFTALGDYSKHKHEMNDEDAKKYVHGEELSVEHGANGYYTMFVCGASIGGAKCSNGKLKNLYPKGLRI